MKDLNKILYDILLKIDNSNGNDIKINHKLLFKYFVDFKNQKSREFNNFESYGSIVGGLAWSLTLFFEAIFAWFFAKNIRKP